MLQTNALVIARNLRHNLNTLLGYGIELDNIEGFDKQCAVAIDNYKDITYAMVVDVSGKILFDSDPARKGETIYTKESLKPLAELSYRVIQLMRDKLKYYEVQIPVFSPFSKFVGVICTGYPEQVIFSKLMMVFLFSAVFAVIFFGISHTFLVFVFSRWVTHPITNLVTVIQEIRKKKVFTQKVAVVSNDEIGELAVTFNKMLDELEWHRRLHIEKEKLEKELEIARMIQTSLLPGSDAFVDDVYDIYAVMIPAAEAGGDYFEITRDKGGRLWFGIGDVTGHGIQSSLIMMMLQTAVFSYINDNPSITPAELVIKTNRVLYENIRKRLKLKNFMTLSFFVCSNDGNFRFAGKHLPALIYRRTNMQCEMIDVKGFWAGILPEIQERVATVDFKLNREDILILYSDGILEAMNNAHEQYGFERFLDSVNLHCSEGKKEAREIATEIVNELFMFMEKQRDDLTLLIVRRR